LLGLKVKITKSQLKQIIKEEFEGTVTEDLAWEHIDRITQDLDRIETQELRENYLDTILTRLNALLIEVEESNAPYN
jgi:hypothetical protein|tara:strand:- start:350 stop:580 length:231 start_codon:yes stop_codon:yes gene_type:complete